MLMLPFSQTPKFLTYPRHVPGLHIVKQLPIEMVAGSSYEWTVSFVNPKSEESLMNVTLEIAEEKTLIGLGEFKIEGTLESYDNPIKQHQHKNLYFNEVSGGVFQSLKIINKRFNIITIKISSVPNLMPGKYTFTLTIILQHKN